MAKENTHIENEAGFKALSVKKAVPVPTSINPQFSKKYNTPKKQLLDVDKLYKGILEKNQFMLSELNIDYGYPCLINNTEYTNQAKEWASELWGKKNIIDMDLRMGGEDFAYFAQIYPATFFRIGVCPTEVKVLPGGLHSSNFFADENAIEVGAVTFAWLALSFLNK